MKQIKYLLFGVAIALLLITVGCQGTQNNEEGMYDRNNQNDQYENTRNNNNRYNNMTDNNRNNRYNNVTDGDRTTRNNRNNTLDNQRIENRTDRMSNRGDRYEVAEEAADKITDDIDEINYAYVLTTQNNAYVAAVLNDDKNNDNTDNNKSVRNDRDNNPDRKKGESHARDNNRNFQNISNDTDADDLTDEVKDEISDIVQSVDNNIDNVYVTTNPDFANLTNDYVNDMNDGRPVRGFFDQIGNMIERIFPQNK